MIVFPSCMICDGWLVSFSICYLVLLVYLGCVYSSYCFYSSCVFLDLINHVRHHIMLSPHREGRVQGHLLAGYW